MSYSEFVASRAKDPKEIVAEYTELKAELDHAAKGISGEAGELMDAVKKYTVYNKVLDLANVIEELGDLEFYMEMMRQAIGVDRDYILNKNMDKLSRRYPKGYTDAHAAQRMDKE
jgi:NTP pyrophosphatase (non-canonical NTP hydrolase)